MKITTLVACSLAGSAIAHASYAGTYQVRFTGTIEYNQIVPLPLGAGHPGNPAVLQFKVNSANFQNSPNFPVRGYVIDPSSFQFIVNGTPVGLWSAVTPHYFVLRNNDPGVDGFYISEFVDFPIGVQLAQSHPTQGPFVELCSVTYPSTQLSSLDIAGAVGTYRYTGLSVFDWETTAGPFSPMGMIFEQLTIELLPPPCPADFDASGAVDGADLGTLLGAWGTSGPADLNGDHTVDGADLGVLLGAWGTCQ